MKKFFLFLYLFSFLVTGSVFGLSGNMTAELTPASRSGNGNPYIFFIMFLQPFILFFLYGTVAYSMRGLATLKTRSIQLCAVLSLSAAALIFALTLWQINQTRAEILRVNDTFTSLSQVGYLNVYTNNLFFNAYTFTMVGLLCFFIGCIWALSIKKKTAKLNNNKINLVK